MYRERDISVGSTAWKVFSKSHPMYFQTMQSLAKVFPLSFDVSISFLKVLIDWPLSIGWQTPELPTNEILNLNYCINLLLLYLF